MALNACIATYIVFMPEIDNRNLLFGILHTISGGWFCHATPVFPFFEVGGVASWTKKSHASG